MEPFFTCPLLTHMTEKSVLGPFSVLLTGSSHFPSLGLCFPFFKVASLPDPPPEAVRARDKPCL